LGPIYCPETLVTKYPPALCNNQEEQRSHCWAYVVFGLQGILQDKLKNFGCTVLIPYIFVCLCMYLYIYVLF